MAILKSSTVFNFACWLVFFCLFGALPWPALAESPPKRLFILHSYESDHICGQPQQEGVVKALAEAGWQADANLTVQTYFMDTYRTNNTPELIKAQGDRALQAIRQFQPDLLVVIDDNAFRTVVPSLVDQPMAIVFTGMNGQPEDYKHAFRFMESREKPGHNVTGVYEKLHVRDAVRIMSHILPDLKKVRVLTDTSPTGKAIARQVDLELAGGSHLSCQVESRVIGTWEEFQKEIDAINRDPATGAYYLGTVMLKDRQGKVYTAPQMIAWDLQKCRKPAMPINYSYCRLGLFGGASVDFKAMGQQAGKMAEAIFQGTSAGDIPIEAAERYALVFNLKRAQKLGVAIPLDILAAADLLIN
jgi:putative tryptophan/tyrosine transport system substrate-binding protein